MKKWKITLIVVFVLIFNVQVFKAAVHIVEEKQEAMIEKPSLEIVGELENIKATKYKILEYPNGYREYYVIFEKEDGSEVELKGLSKRIMQMVPIGDVISAKYTATNHIKELRTVQRAVVEEEK